MEIWFLCPFSIIGNIVFSSSLKIFLKFFKGWLLKTTPSEPWSDDIIFSVRKPKFRQDFLKVFPNFQKISKSFVPDFASILEILPHFRKNTLPFFESPQIFPKVDYSRHPTWNLEWWKISLACNLKFWQDFLKGLLIFSKLI